MNRIVLLNNAKEVKIFETNNQKEIYSFKDGIQKFLISKDECYIFFIKEYKIEVFNTDKFSKICKLKTDISLIKSC